MLLLLALQGCAPQISADDPVRLSFSSSEMFHVAASYKVIAPKTEENPVALEAGVAPTFGEHWSDEVVWTYQVVDAGYTPTASDELYPYAVTAAGDVAKIAVLRAWVDPTLNDDTELLEADPVVYLVFRADRDRLAAIVQFVNVDGDRVERAWTSSELGRSWSVLSQSMVTGLPTYLAPFGTHYATEERVLENGSVAASEVVADGVVDTFYDDELGGGLVVSRYEYGKPWPTATIADNVESRLLDASEVERRRAQGMPLDPVVPDDYDYLGALSQAIDIDAALKLDADTIDGGWQSQTIYKPWAGSWWPQKKGALVFGYGTRKTLSDRIEPTVEPMRKELDALSEKLRKLDQTSAEYKTTLDSYKTKQSAYVDALVKFYDTVLADLNGGRLTVKSGKLTHVDGWSYDLSELSPMDKFALQMWDRKETSPNPFYMPAWELLNHYSPSGGSWWGHCNGWAAAAILTNEPRASVTTKIAGNDVVYTSADLKGLLTESHYSTYSHFYGERYNDEKNDIKDLTPKAFHTIISHYLRDRKVPFVFDTTASAEVWNFPVYAADLEVVEEGGAPGADGKINVNTSSVAEIDALSAISTTVAKAVVAYREANGPFQKLEDLMKVKGIKTATFGKIKDLVTIEVVGNRTFLVSATMTFATDGVDETHIDGSAPESFTETYMYTLVTDKDGNVLSGAWGDDQKHPDFAWVPYDNPAARSSGGSENPYLPYSSLLSTVGDLRRK
jgi:competence ComEA-like helix-hairpin-helix protein